MLKTSKLRAFTETIANGSINAINDAFDALQNDEAFQSIGWKQNFSKLRAVLNTGIPQYSVFTIGNSKLPFISFSVLPGVTCPGAGECLKFCYSFRAWRYPAAFMRQCQNTILMRFNRDAITNALAGIVTKMPQGFDMRLYVDGDFASTDDVTFWFELLNKNPTIRAYGYSKSFDAILGFTGAWPTNYQLNISGGHNANDATVNRVKALPITRGEFIAVSIGRKIKSNDHGTPSVNRALRETFKTKAFTCPGKCGSCTGKGHACGMSSLKGLPIIIIAMH